MGEVAWTANLGIRREHLRSWIIRVSIEGVRWDGKTGGLDRYSMSPLSALGDRADVQYYPVMNTPVTASVTILSDPPIKAKLREDIVQGVPDSVYRDDVPVFHGLSVSGDVTGQVVYAGYGRKRDFEALQAKGELLLYP